MKGEITEILGELQEEQFSWLWIEQLTPVTGVPLLHVHTFSRHNCPSKWYPVLQDLQCTLPSTVHDKPSTDIPLSHEQANGLHIG